MLKKAMKSKIDRENFSKFVRETRVHRYSAVAYNILGKYKKAFPQNKICTEWLRDNYTPVIDIDEVCLFNNY